MSDIFFPKCYELFQRSDRVGSSLKTCVVSLVSTMETFSRKLPHTWKAKATKYGRWLFQLQPSMHRIGGIESGSLLLTPTASENERDIEKFKTRMEKYPNGTTMPNLATQISALPTLLRTPDAIAMLPTATNRDYKGRRQGKLHAVVHHHAQAGENIGSTLRLEPAFVEWMMGFPTNWTSLEAETTEPHD